MHLATSLHERVVLPSSADISDLQELYGGNVTKHGNEATFLSGEETIGARAGRGKRGDEIHVFLSDIDNPYGAACWSALMAYRDHARRNATLRRKTVLTDLFVEIPGIRAAKEFLAREDLHPLMSQGMYVLAAPAAGNYPHQVYKRERLELIRDARPGPELSPDQRQLFWESKIDGLNTVPLRPFQDYPPEVSLLAVFPRRGEGVPDLANKIFQLDQVLFSQKGQSSEFDVTAALGATEKTSLEEYRDIWESAMHLTIPLAAAQLVLQRLRPGTSL